MTKARNDVELEISFDPKDFEKAKSMAPKFTNIDTFMQFYRYFIPTFCSFRVFTPLLASNALHLPFTNSSAVADYRARLRLEEELLLGVDNARFQEAQTPDPNSTNTSVVPVNYRRVAIHKLIPGCAPPDVTINQHIQYCKPNSAYLFMTNEAIVSFA